MQNKKQTELLKPFELLNQALDIYNKKIQTLLVIMAIPVLFNIGALLFHLEAGLFGDILIGIISAVVSIWAYLCLIYVLRKKDLTVKKAFIQSKGKILSYILINFLIAVATIPGIILLGIPTVIYMVWFSFSAFVLIEEDYHGSNALMRSREYVTGRWGKVAWRVLFMILMLLAFQWIGSLLAKLITTPAIIYFPFNSRVITELIGGLFSNIIAFLTVPLSLSYTYLLYLDLKKTRPELANKPVNEKYKWLYILSPTTVVILIIILTTLLFQIATGI